MMQAEFEHTIHQKYYEGCMSRLNVNAKNFTRTPLQTWALYIAWHMLYCYILPLVKIATTRACKRHHTCSRWSGKNMECFDQTIQSRVCFNKVVILKAHFTLQRISMTCCLQHATDRILHTEQGLGSKFVWPKRMFRVQMKLHYGDEKPKLVSCVVNARYLPNLVTPWLSGL